MEQPPAPPVTIEGGSGWQLQDGSPDEVRQDPVDRQAPRLRWVVLGAVAVLALVWSTGGRQGPAPVAPGAQGSPPAAEAATPALVLRTDGVRFEQGRALMSVDVVESATGPVSVVAVQTIPGLAVRLLAPDGREVPLPLAVADAGQGPVPLGGDRPASRLLAELSLASCASLPPMGLPYKGGTLVELRTVAPAGPSGPTSAFVGARYPLVPQLTSTGC